jgi:choice-of-anchor B domain-containing protein
MVMRNFIVSSILLIIVSNFLIGQTSHRIIKYCGPLKFSGEQFNAVWGYTRPDGREYSVVGARTAIRIYDITDPWNPTIAFNKTGLTSTVWREFKSYRNYVYGVCDNCGNQGLFIINMDSLYTNEFRQQVDTFSSAHNIYIDTSNARLYIVGARNWKTNASAGVYIYSLANPANPSLLKFYNLGGRYAHDIFVRDNIAYSSEGYNGTYVYDMNNVNNITLLSSTAVKTGYHHSNWLSDDGQYLYSAREVPTGLPLSVYKMNNNLPQNPVDFSPQYANIPNVVTAHNPFVFKNKLFVSYYKDGLIVFDLANPYNPKTLAYYDTFGPTNDPGGYDGAWGVFPYYNSGSIVVSDITNGFYVFGLVSEIIHNQDVVLNTPGAGFILNHHHGKSKLSVNDAGQFILTTLASSNPLLKAKDADLKSETNLILRSPNGSYFKLNTNGTTLSTSTFTPNLSTSTFYQGDIEFESSRGPLLNWGANWYRVKINIQQSLGVMRVY